MATDRGAEAKRRLVNNLRSSLGPTIMAALDDPLVVEVMLNPDGSLFIERIGHGVENAGRMEPHDAENVIGKVAHALKTVATQDRPIISGELPPDGHRFEGILPPAAPAPVFNIRKRASMLIRLDRYVADGIMTPAQVEVIREAIADRLNIVISGGTGTGKTTLTNAILAELVEVTPDHRLVILEDTAEIQCSAKNHVSLHT
ncbi:ATPase, T2SS/T4P/T4SS family, partial [Mesorhizobium sp. YIM 152430]|uniref:ATPase, T2SS/T4P/T4SS family n=1 Tax=Mesorhizobium sp. YIM 152430 TaxID=3031761 RepID=UPI0023DBD974